MKPSIICTAVFSIFSLVFTQAQNAQPLRAISKQDHLAIQQGELRNFNYLLLRLNSAIEDADQKSTDEMHTDLCKLMEMELGQAPAADQTVAKNRERQSNISEALAAYRFDLGRSALPDFSAMKKLYTEFAELIQAELEFLEKETASQR